MNFFNFSQAVYGLHKVQSPISKKVSVVHLELQRTVHVAGASSIFRE